MMEELLNLLEKNARLSEDQLSALLSLSKEEINAEIARCEKENIILGYNTLVNWEKVDPSYCSAMIKLKVQPKRDYGYDEIAAEIVRFDEVETVWLMSSSSYDLAVIVRGQSFRDIAMFVAKRLATLDTVTSTATNFILKRYKEEYIPFIEAEKDERSLSLG